jgi:hypothetical protein
VFRTELARQVGGWPATPTGVDAAFVANMSMSCEGYLSEWPLLAYRQHPGQSTALPYHVTHRDITTKMVFDRK